MGEHARPADDCSKRCTQFVGDCGQKLIFHPARRFRFLARPFLLQQDLFALVFDAFALSNVPDERQPAMFATKVHWFGREKDPSHVP